MLSHMLTILRQAGVWPASEIQLTNEVSVLALKSFVPQVDLRSQPCEFGPVVGRMLACLQEFNRSLLA